MADNKKYYYLKLKDNFFESDEMIILESMPDGYVYSNILLKLYLRSLKNDGRLMFNDRIPFNTNMLAQVTRHSVGDEERAMKIFQELELIEVLDNGAIYLADIQNYIGHSSTEADRKRAYRAKISAEQKQLLMKTGQMSGQMSAECPDKYPPEKELELEIEREIELEQNNADAMQAYDKPVAYEKIRELFNSTCVSFAQVSLMSERRKETVRARVKQYGGVKVFQELFEKAEASDFLKGKNSRGWKADFDWLIKEANMAKVLEDRYINQEEKQNEPVPDLGTFQTKTVLPY